jgi:hypothetical protein
MKIKGTYKFRNWDLEFTDFDVEINPIVSNVNPIDKTIDVQIIIKVDNENVKGTFAPDINPVPVENLNYDEGTLVQRIIDRLNDFKIS